MKARIVPALAASLLALAACGKKAEPPPPATEPAPTPEAAAPAAAPTEAASFVGRTWVVAESKQVAKGSLRVFLPDGTLVMSDAGATPAFGSWRYADGRLTIVEEGREYPTEILELSERAFRIRMHGPGEPVEIRFTPAPREPSPAAAETELAAADVAAPAVESLVGTAWRLEDLTGAGVLDRRAADARVHGARGARAATAPATASMASSRSRATRSASAGIATTRRACPEAVMRQETQYLAALQDSERYEREGETLRSTSRGPASAVALHRHPAAAAPAANTIARAAPSGNAALTGIWTIVDHHYSPGVSALTDEEASARYGETLRLTDAVAISPGKECREPRYATSQVPAAAYLASAFNITPERLRRSPPQPDAGHGDVLRRRPTGPSSAAPARGRSRPRACALGRRVLRARARPRLPRLRRSPGWQLELRKGVEMRFTYDYGKGTAVTPAPRTQLDTQDRYAARSTRRAGRTTCA